MERALRSTLIESASGEAHRLAVNQCVSSEPISVNGKNDPRVSVKVARQVVEPVRQTGGSVAYLEAADERHGFAKKKNSDLLFLEEVAFLGALAKIGSGRHGTVGR